MMEVTDRLAKLCARLETTDPLNEQLAKAKRRAATDNLLERMLAGQTYGEAVGDLSILNQHEDSFRAELKSIDNDIERQIDIIHEALDGWFGKGLAPPPYYPWRIAVILSKAKRKEEEKRFLSAWCRHFGSWKGGRYEALASRLKKMHDH